MRVSVLALDAKPSTEATGWPYSITFLPVVSDRGEGKEKSREKEEERGEKRGGEGEKEGGKTMEQEAQKGDTVLLYLLTVLRKRHRLH